MNAIQSTSPFESLVFYRHAIPGTHAGLCRLTPFRPRPHYQSSPNYPAQLLLTQPPKRAQFLRLTSEAKPPLEPRETEVLLVNPIALADHFLLRIAHDSSRRNRPSHDRSLLANVGLYETAFCQVFHKPPMHRCPINLLALVSWALDSRMQRKHLRLPDPRSKSKKPIARIRTTTIPQRH